jgi:transcriptional regulator with XRE-family HTH domain
MHTYSARLAVFRRTIGETSSKMAERMGVSKSFYEKVEYGDRGPSYNFICRFKRAFPTADAEYIFLDTVNAKNGEDVIVDLENRVIKRTDKDLPLSPIEFGLASLLIENRHRTVTYCEMLDIVWGLDYGGGPETVQAAISRLRSKLGTKDLIDTITGYGYRWKG